MIVTADSIADDVPAVLSSRHRSPAFQAAILRLARFARDDTASILIQGESGTGKTTLARYVHQLSPRRRGPFQNIVLSSLEDSLATSDLFGHVAGAYTDARRSRAGHFVSANGGTLFLDEIGKASRTLQARLLHALEYGDIRPVGSDREIHVNVRTVAATNVDLHTLVNQGVFLPDLLARLSAFRVILPPLRERRPDIPNLVNESVQRHARAAGYGEQPPEIASDLMLALRNAPWPDNIRQLDGVVHRLLVEAEGAPTITLAHCTSDLSFLGTLAQGGRGVSRIHAAQAVEHARGNISAAARALGVDRKTIRNRLKPNS
jgi:DNA-binding NtrC family response regulator